MNEVVMEYEYNVIAGRGNSSCQSLAEQAYMVAKAFYGDQKFTVHVEVSGKREEFYVRCTARADIKVSQ